MQQIYDNRQFETKSGKKYPTKQTSITQQQNWTTMDEPIYGNLQN